MKIQAERVTSSPTHFISRGGLTIFGDVDDEKAFLVAQGDALVI